MAEHRLLAALILAMVSAGHAAGADTQRHFEGPYHVTITPLERVRATVTSTFRFPNLVASEWWAAFPWPPEFEGQPRARVQVRIVEAPSAEADQITDESALHQPLVALHWFPDGLESAHAITAEATYDVTITRRALEPGPPSTPARRLTPLERSAFLASTSHFDFQSLRFQNWLRKQELRRQLGERDLDFAYRAMDSLAKSHTYRFELNSKRSASAVAAAGWSDCGGLATIYVSILRAAGIPARCLSGRSISPNTTHVKMDFYANEIGWVPADPAVAVGSHRAEPGFGREHFDMVITHFDLVRLRDQYHWMQGIGTAHSLAAQGSALGMTFEHSMQAEVLPLEADLTRETAKPVDPEKPTPAPVRSRNRRHRGG
jgi:transglutaminase-like putative cysteine protease